MKKKTWIKPELSSVEVDDTEGGACSWTVESAECHS